MGLFKCKHKMPRKVMVWSQGMQVPYLKIKSIQTDGIDIKHARLYVECDHCGVDFHCANVHLPNPDRSEVEMLKKRIKELEEKYEPKYVGESI